MRSSSRPWSALAGPLPVLELDPVVRPRALEPGLREGAPHARAVTGRDVVLLHERVVNHLAIRVLGVDQVRDLGATPLARPRRQEPLVRLADATARFPLAQDRAPGPPCLRHLDDFRRAL